MAKHKKKRPAEGRLKVIAGGGGVKAVLPGKGPQWKKDRAQAPSTGAHAASSPKSGPPNRRRDEGDDESDAASELPLATSTRRSIPRSWTYGAIGVVVLIVAYFLLRNPAPGETPASTAPAASASASTPLPLESAPSSPSTAPSSPASTMPPSPASAAP